MKTDLHNINVDDGEKTENFKGFIEKTFNKSFKYLVEVTK